MKKSIFFMSGLMVLLGAGCTSEDRKPLTVAPQPAQSESITFYGDARNQLWLIETLDKKILNDSENADLYLQRGIAYKNLILAQMVSSHTKDYALMPEWKVRAVEDFNTVMRLDPESAQAHFELEKVSVFKSFP